MISKKTNKYFKENNYEKIKHNNCIVFYKIINGIKLNITTFPNSVKKQSLFCEIESSSSSFKSLGHVDNVEELEKHILPMLEENKV